MCIVYFFFEMQWTKAGLTYLFSHSKKKNSSIRLYWNLVHFVRKKVQAD